MKNLGMDNSTSCETEPDNSSKKSPFDSLPQAELVKKCKNLLVIAQKAKQARDASLEENRVLKDDINNYEQQKKSDKECLKTMQEMIESLTQHKLKSITNIDEQNKKIKTLEITNDSFTKLNILNEEKLSQLETENLSLNRQISRLTEDNDKLLQELELLETKLLSEKNSPQTEFEQKLKLLVEENKVLKNEKIKLNEEITAITSEVEQKTEETIDNLRSISNDNTGLNKNKILKELKTNLAEIRSQCDELKSEFEETQENCEKETEQLNTLLSQKKLEINTDCENLERLLEKKQQENKVLIDEINKYIYENSELNTKITQLELSEKQIHLENGILRDKVKNMNMEYEENNKLIQNLKIELDFQISRLSAEKKRARGENKERGEKVRVNNIKKKKNKKERRRRRRRKRSMKGRRKSDKKKKEDMESNEKTEKNEEKEKEKR